MMKLFALSMAGLLTLAACSAGTTGDADAGATDDTAPAVTTETTPPTTVESSVDTTGGSGYDYGVDDPTPGTDAPPTTVPPAQDGGTMTGSNLPAPAQLAIADLASRLGIAPDAVTFVAMEEVDWPDGSLGCPQPGMSYTQAIVNGYKITLEADGVAYAYHGKAAGDPFLCVQTKTSKGDTGTGSGTIDLPTTTLSTDY